MVRLPAHLDLTDRQVERIGGLLKMTKVGQLFERERLKYGNEQTKPDDYRKRFGEALVDALLE